MGTVNSCCCFELRTGGLIIGWLHLIGGIMSAISSILVIWALNTYSCADLKHAIDYDWCTHNSEGLIGVNSIAIVMSIVFAFIAWRCIQGIKERDPLKLKPMLVVSGVVAVLPALYILSLNPHDMLLGIIGCLINRYFFVVIRSLLNEYESYAANRPNHPVAYECGALDN